MEKTGHGDEVLVFVYNADSDIFSELKDYVHKAVSPSPYDCPLCALTYGTTGMKRQWKSFVKGLGFRVEFLHRDEIKQKYPSVAVPLPAILKRSGPSLTMVMNAQEIGACRDLEDLMDMLTYKLRHTGVMMNVA